MGDFLSRVTLKFDGWPWKTIVHLFYATSSFVHHFIAICDLKPELQSENAQFMSLRVKISRGARLEVQNGTQQDLNEIIDLVNFGGKKIVYMLTIWGFRNGTNKIWIKW